MKGRAAGLRFQAASVESLFLPARQAAWTEPAGQDSCTCLLYSSDDQVNYTSHTVAPSLQLVSHVKKKKKNYTKQLS